MELNRESRGRGPEVVLLHGWGMNLRVFDPLAAELARELRVTVVDLPGHGRSPWDPRFDAPDACFEALLAALPRRTHLLGWSLGGQWAMRLAAHIGPRIERLVLIATTPRFVASADWPWGLRPAVLEQFAQALRTDYRRTVTDFLELQVRGSAAAPQVLASLAAALRAQGDADPRALAAGLAQLREHDLRALAGGIRIPALVISGQHDRVTSPGAAEALARLLPQAQALAIARSAHAPFLSHTATVAQAILDFVRPVRSERRAGASSARP
jgi:pimeloyl-[acyl-carrier protein] methyl ester esterase